MTTATYAPTASAVHASQLAPYGIFGDLARTIAPVAGGALGGLLGNQQLGGQIGNAVGQIASLLPFSAGPQVPQTMQQHPLVQQQIAQQIAVQQAVQQQALAQQAIAHQQAIAQQQQQLAPYGFFGDLARTIAPVAGNALGGLLGNQQLGGQIGGAVGQIAGLLPFSAGPQMPQVPQQQQLAPYGFIGGALGNVLGGLGGGALGGLFGNSDLGRTIGTTAGSVLGAILPFSAGPQMPGVQPWQYQYN